MNLIAEDKKSSLGIIIAIFFMIAITAWDLLNPSEVSSRYGGQLPIFYIPWSILQILGFAIILLGILNRKRYTLIMGMLLQIVNLVLLQTALKPPGQLGNTAIYGSVLFLLIWIYLFAIKWKQYH